MGWGGGGLKMKSPQLGWQGSLSTLCVLFLSIHAGLPGLRVWASHFLSPGVEIRGFALSHPHWLTCSFMCHAFAKQLSRLRRSVCGQGRQRKASFLPFLPSQISPAPPSPSRSSSSLTKPSLPPPAATSELWPPLAPTPRSTIST